MSIIGIFHPPNNLVLKRSTGAATYADGYAQQVTRGSVSFGGSVQPLTGDELLDLEEGQRSRDPRIILTETELKTVDKSTGIPADIVEYEGKDYVVYKVEPYVEWSGGGVQHYEVTILRKDQ